MGNSDVFIPIENENFLDYPYLDQLKTLAMVLPYAWTLPFGLVAARIMGVRRLERKEFSRAFAENNEKLLEERKQMHSKLAQEHCDLVMELNQIGIEMNGAGDREEELLQQCKALKNEAVQQRSIDRAKAFVNSADELSVARGTLIAIMTRKNEKQKQIIELLKRIDVVEPRDLKEIAAVVFVDSIASIDAGKLSPFGTTFKTSELTAKYLANEMQKIMMSPKILDRAILLRERSQARFRAWKQLPHVRDLLS